MCNACKERGILKREDAERLLKEVRRIIHRQLGLEIQHEIELVLEEMNSGGQIAAAAAKLKGDEGSPLGESELGLFRRRGDEFTIFLLYGVPREMMLETAAHELAHAWQAENCPPTQSEQIREGFAQWVAAQVLKSEQQLKVLAKLEARTDNPYGTGYQMVKRIAERYGAKRTIQKMKTME